MPTSGHPDWTRDELLLALDLYFRGGRYLSRTHPEVIALSDTLGRLPLHLAQRESTHRSPHDVYMKLMAFRAIDPAEGGADRAHDNDRERTTWHEFADDRARLRGLAAAIARADTDDAVDIEAEAFPEGRLLYAMHRQRETRASALALLHSSRRQGCSGCGMPLVDTYGVIGESLLEVHDTTDLAEIADRKPANATLVIICPTCHRALHRRRPWLGADDVRLLTSPRSSGTSRAAEGMRPQAQPAKVDDLAKPVAAWLKERCYDERVRWPYHPRSNDLSDFVRRVVLQDLLATCAPLRNDALTGAIACDLNLQLLGRTGQARKLDMVLGRPVESIGRGTPAEPLRKAKITEPLVSLEVKSCMTEHGKAIPRLIGELLQSVDVVKTTNPRALALAVVIVNAADRFTSPLRQPGPNIHDQPGAARKVIEQLVRRVAPAHGSYDAVALVVIDFDNERRASAEAPSRWVPDDRTYAAALATMSTRYRDVTAVRSEQ